MGTRAMRSIFASSILLLSTSLHAMPPVYTIQGGIGGTDIGRKTDNYYYLTGSVLGSRGISRKAILDLQAEISTYDYDDNDDLDGEELFLQATYSYTPRAGFQVPTYALGLRHTEEYLSGDDMDASTTTLLISMSYRLNDRSKLTGGLKSGQRDASSDSDPKGYFINYDYRYSPEWLLYSTLGGGEGAFTVRSFCSGAYRGNYGYRYRTWNANRSPDDCDDLYLTLGGSYVIDAVNSLDLSVSHHEYDLPGGDLSGNFYSVDFFHRF